MDILAESIEQPGTDREEHSMMWHSGREQSAVWDGQGRAQYDVTFRQRAERGLGRTGKSTV